MNRSPATAQQRRHAVDQVLALRASGAHRTLSTVAPQYGVSSGTLRRWMEECGVPDEPSGPETVDLPGEWPALAGLALHATCGQPLITIDRPVAAYLCASCRHRPTIPATTADSAVHVAIRTRAPKLAGQTLQTLLRLLNTVRIDDRGRCVAMTWRLQLPQPAQPRGGTCPLARQ